MKYMRKGFTLVELLVVVSIIAILTIITVGQFQLAKKRANDSQRKTDISNLSNALKMYYADYGLFPEESDGKIADENGNPIEWGGEFKDGDYVYMKVMPKDNSNIPYCYVVDANRKSFGLFAMLENTADSQCVTNNGVGAYDHCGNDYCYSIVSPNIDVNSLNGL